MEGLAESQAEAGGGGGGGGGGMGDCEETVCAIATAVNSLKSQSVSLANRHRKRWREVAQRCRGGGKREAAVSGTSRDSMEGDTGGNVGNMETEEAGVVAGGGSREMQREKMAVQEEGSTHTLGESTVGATGMEKEVEEGVRRSAGERLVEPAVLQLLNRYSEQLVELVRERTLHLPAD